MLEDDGNFTSADISIDPPSDSDFSGEDSGPEDGGRVADNLPGKRVSASAHVIIQRGNTTITVIGDEEATESSASTRMHETSVERSTTDGKRRTCSEHRLSRNRKTSCCFSIS